MWLKDNPRAIVNLVPGVVKEKFEQHVFEHPEYFDEDERDLLKMLREANKTPSPVDNRLRLRFWMEYDYCQTYMSKGIDISRVIAGICSREYFYTKYLRQPSKVGWLLCPPSAYMLKAEEALEFGLDQLRDILEQSHLAGGKVDTKLGELKLKIVALLEPRVRGAVVQKSMNMHAVSASPAAAQAVAQSLAGPSMEQLERRRRSLHDQRESLKNGGAHGRPTSPEAVEE